MGNTQQKIPQRSKSKVPQVEAIYYQSHFIVQFCKHNPDFVKELISDLFPLHLDIFGRHEETTPLLSEWNVMLAAAITEKDNLFFAIQVQSKLKFVYEIAVDEENFFDEKLKVKTDNLFNKIFDIVERKKLLFETDGDHVLFWLAHWLLCQAEAGSPSLRTPLRQIVDDLPPTMLRELWSELPELEQTLIMKNQETYYRSKGIFDRYKHQFESLEVFMKTQLFKTLPQPAMFDFRAFNIYEDVDHYEKMAVKAFKEHIKNYTERMKNALKENGFKQNKEENYSQTEWLVLWNCGIKSKEEILRDINSDGDESTINAAFRKLGKYGLPVRKQNKKNLERKKV
jgi:hypothetical protein